MKGRLHGLRQWPTVPSGKNGKNISNADKFYQYGPLILLACYNLNPFTAFH